MPALQSLGFLPHYKKRACPKKDKPDESCLTTFLRVLPYTISLYLSLITVRYRRSLLMTRKPRPGGPLSVRSSEVIFPCKPVPGSHLPGLSETFITEVLSSSTLCRHYNSKVLVCQVMSFYISYFSGIPPSFTSSVKRSMQLSTAFERSASLIFDLKLHLYCKRLINIYIPVTLTFANDRGDYVCIS